MIMGARHVETAWASWASASQPADGTRKEVDMSKLDSSPLQRYLRHLENGELAYQYSPVAGRPVFFPRVACPYTGNEDLEWLSLIHI